MREQYKLIFTGQLQPNVDKTYVVDNLSTLLKIPKEKADIFISQDKERVIKRNLSQEVALKYKKKLSDAGLQIKISVESLTTITSSQVQENVDKEQIPQKAVSKVSESANIEESIRKTPNSNVTQTVPDKMGLIGLFGRFTMYYLLSMIVLSIILNLINYKGSSGSAFVIIVLSVIFSCTSFAKKNRRYLTKKERVKATLGFSSINILFQFLFTSIALIGLSKPITLNIILIIVAIPFLIHTPLIYFIIGTNRKRMLKRGEITA